MSVYHQMGHHSVNLLNSPELNSFSGAILSPVNYNEDEIRSQMVLEASRDSFDMIFDPQLYYPRTERGKLRDWSYFPNDVDTADLSSIAWWSVLLDRILATSTQLNINHICCPAFAPNVYTNDYYSLIINIGNYLIRQLNNTSISAIQTVLTNLIDLTVPTRALEIASIISRTQASRIYLVFVSNTIPRRELANVEELKGAMKLIRLLENAGLSVIVGFSSSDLVLWKAAGASSCATGKFFNLRRFTSSRFEEPTEGGGQLPYWFEESLMAFLRESDIIRLQRANLLGNSRNPYSNEIFNAITTGQPWLGMSWRQYMYAFADLEKRLHIGSINLNLALKQSENNWLTVEDNNILMEEQRNNGDWLRAWRRAIAEFATF